MLQKAFGESSMHVNELFTNSTNAFKEVVNLLKMIMELDDHAHQQKLMKRWKKLRKKSMAIVVTLLGKLPKKLVSRMVHVRQFSLILWA